MSVTEANNSSSAAKAVDQPTAEASAAKDVEEKTTTAEETKSDTKVSVFFETCHLNFGDHLLSLVDET